MRTDPNQFALERLKKTHHRLQRITDARWSALADVQEALGCFGSESWTFQHAVKKERVAILELRLAEEAYATACEFVARLYAESRGVNLDDDSDLAPRLEMSLRLVHSKQEAS